MEPRLHPATCGEQGRRMAVLLGMVRRLASDRRFTDDERCNAQTWAWLLARQLDLNAVDLAIIARRAVSRALRPHDGLQCQPGRHDTLRRPRCASQPYRDAELPRRKGAGELDRLILRDWIAVAASRLTPHERHYLYLRAQGLSGRETIRQMGLSIKAGQRMIRRIRDVLRDAGR